MGIISYITYRNIWYEYTDMIQGGITNGNNSKNKRLYSIVTVGLMAALVYVGNYLQIKIPNGGLVTRIHLGNSMCLLAGLLFGRLRGGLSSGIGAALYDLFDPVYIVSAPYTFFSKFAMGFTAGHIRKHSKMKRAQLSGRQLQVSWYISCFTCSRHSSARYFSASLFPLHSSSQA